MDTASSQPLVQVNGEAGASPDGMDTMHGLLEQYWIAAEAALPQCPDDGWRALFDTSVSEIAGNIVRHAQPASRMFHVSFRCYAEHMEATLSDDGVPYVLRPLVGSADMRDAVALQDFDGGWGLPIAHAAADGVDYERAANGRNYWRIKKRIVF